MFRLFPVSLFIMFFVITTGPVLAVDNNSSEISTGDQVQNYQSLADLEWRYRLILARSSDIDDVLEMFEKYTEAIDDRKIAWFVQTGDRLHSNISKTLSSALTAEIKRYLENYQDNDMVLIGYDGEAKAVDNLLGIVNFFEEIDRMPIRQYEMAND